MKSFAVFGLVFALTCSAVAAAPAQWTRFRLNPSNNVAIAAAETPAWTVETGGQYSSSPSIVGDTLFVGNNHGLLLALDPRTGATRWKYQAQSSLMSNPLVYRGLVIVGEGNSTWLYFGNGFVCVGNGPSGLIALDAATGKVRWRYHTAGSAMPTPVIEGGRLVHHDGAGFMTSLDPMTGKEYWIHNISTIASMVGLMPVSNNTVVSAGTFPSAVFAVDPSDGKKRWSYDLASNDSGVGDCPPASDGRNVYCDYTHPLDEKVNGQIGAKARLRAYAVNAITGAQVWNVPLELGVLPDRNEAAIPVVDGGRLFFGSSLSRTMHALDTRTGKVLWTMRPGAPVKGGIVVQNGTLYFGDQAGFLWAVDAGSGRVIGAKSTGVAYGVASPVIYGGSLIIGSNSGRLAAVPLAEIRAGKDRPAKNQKRLPPNKKAEREPYGSRKDTNI